MTSTILEPKSPRGLDFPFKTKPYPYQLRALELLLQNPRFALLMEMGLGKTKVMIDLHCIINTKFENKKPWLIVCPKSLIYNWENEYKTHAWAPIKVLSLLGSQAKKEATIQQANISDVPCALITNYEGLNNILKPLLEMDLGCTTFDESTKVKNYRSKRSKQCKKFSRKSERSHILTGNVSPNGPLDVYSQFAIMSHDMLGFYSFIAFKHHFAVLGGWKGKEVISYKNLEELSDKIHKASYMVEKKQVLPDLPDKLYQTVEVDLQKDQKKAYNQMRDAALMEIQEHRLTAPVVLAKLTRLSQITGGFIKDEEGRLLSFSPNCKMDALRDIVEGLPEKKKFIIWARFIPELKAVQELLTGFGIKSELFYGETSEEKRRGIIKEFQDTTSDLRAIVGQVETGGYGHTLTEACYVIYFSNSYSYGDRIQSEDRAHRIGLTHQVQYIDIVVRSTIDRSIQAALKMKKDLGQMLSTANIKDMI